MTEENLDAIFVFELLFSFPNGGYHKCIRRRDCSSDRAVLLLMPCFYDNFDASFTVFCHGYLAEKWLNEQCYLVTNKDRGKGFPLQA